MITSIEDDASESVLFQTRYGTFMLHVWPARGGKEPVALISPHLDVSKPVLVRVHSECLTGDVFDDLRCDCSEQKDLALKLIAESGNGVFIYHRQEGRNIGLFKKIQAYKLQDQGFNTYDANVRLGCLPDARTYDCAARVLRQLGAATVTLITNNPEKVSELQRLGITIHRRLPLLARPNSFSIRYLQVKRDRFHHFLAEDL